MAVIEIPIRQDLPTFVERVALEGRVYFMTFRFNKRLDRWVFDLADQDKSEIVSGIPLLNKFDLFRQYVDDRLPLGSFFLVDESNQGQEPNRTNFAIDVKLYYIESTTEV